MRKDKGFACASGNLSSSLCCLQAAEQVTSLRQTWEAASTQILCSLQTQPLWSYRPQLVSFSETVLKFFKSYHLSSCYVLSAYSLPGVWHIFLQRHHIHPTQICSYYIEGWQSSAGTTLTPQPDPPHSYNPRACAQTKLLIQRLYTLEDGN